MLKNKKTVVIVPIKKNSKRVKKKILRKFAVYLYIN